VFDRYNSRFNPVIKKILPEPWDVNAIEQSFEFWDSHAFVYDKSVLELATETTKKPWFKKR